MTKCDKLFLCCPGFFELAVFKSSHNALLFAACRKLVLACQPVTDTCEGKKVYQKNLSAARSDLT